MRSVPVLLLLPACAAPPPVTIASQNAGTTPFMDALAESDLRDDCEAGYDNNLCTLAVEDALTAALAEAPPAILSLQEMWHDPWCDAEDRDAAWSDPPFACARRGSQPLRVVPDGHHVACSPGYPDNCLAWDPRLFTADLPGEGPDHGLALTDLESTCSGPGRVAWVGGTLDGRSARLVVVHLNAGPFSGDQTCRVAQLEPLDALLTDDPTEVLVIAGDFNVDLATGPGPDRALIDAMRDRHSLRRLPDDGETTRLLPGDLDAVLVAGLPEPTACTVRYVDDGVEPIMLDHALLDCR